MDESFSNDGAYSATSVLCGRDGDEEKMDSGGGRDAYILFDRDGVRWIKPGVDQTSLGGFQSQQLFGKFTHIYTVDKDVAIEIEHDGRKQVFTYKNGDVLAATTSKHLNDFRRMLDKFGVSALSLSEGTGGYRGGKPEDYAKLR